MKLGTLVSAVAGLRKLSAQDLKLKTAYDIYKLINFFNPHLDYFDSNREKIAELADNQDKELAELLDIDIEIGDFQKVKVSLSENANLTALDILSLEPFIDFVE